MKRNIITIITLGVSLFTISCKKNALDTKPTDRLINEYYWQNQKDAEYAVNAIYRLLPSIDYIYLDGATDNAFNQKTFERAYPFGNGTQDPTTSAWSSDYWKNAYAGIQRVNYFLENVDRVPNLTDEIKNRLIGEAKFLRAFFYNDLINLYGDVPLVTTSLNISNGAVPRDPKEKVLSFILSELNLIADFLPLQYAQANKGRITKGAVLALKARVYLLQNNYQEAKIAALAVMDLKQYSLYPDYAKLFTYSAENNSEIIFDKQYIPTTYNHNLSRLLSPPSSRGDGSLVPIRSLVDAYECIDGKTIDQSSLYDPATPYENRDPRLKSTILTPGALTYSGNVFNPTPGSGTVDMIASSQNASITGFNFKKYVNPEDLSENNNNCSINLILMRYADILLIYAESKVETDEIDNTVYEAINKIRVRAGMPEILDGSQTKDELRTIIRRERRVEFALEGTHLFDIRRWKTADVVMNKKAQGISYLKDGNLVIAPAENRKFNPSRDYLWPIPQREIFVNGKLVQNPGY